MFRYDNKSEKAISEYEAGASQKRIVWFGEVDSSGLKCVERYGNRGEGKIAGTVRIKPFASTRSGPASGAVVRGTWRKMEVVWGRVVIQSRAGPYRTPRAERGVVQIESGTWTCREIKATCGRVAIQSGNTLPYSKSRDHAALVYP